MRSKPPSTLVHGHNRRVNGRAPEPPKEYETRSRDGDRLGMTEPNTASDSAFVRASYDAGAAKPSGATTTAKAERNSPKVGSGSNPDESHTNFEARVPHEPPAAMPSIREHVQRMYDAGASTPEVREWLIQSLEAQEARPAPPLDLKKIEDRTTVIFRLALERIVRLDLKKDEQGRDDFYSGPDRFFQSWNIARSALDQAALPSPPAAHAAKE